MTLQTLQQKLPEIRAWIGRTLVLHRGNSRSVASLGFSRLGSFYPAGLLAATRVVETARVPVPPLVRMGLREFAEFEHGNFDGITYLDTYFVQTAQADRESLHFHELVHVVQWQHLGPDRFLIAYALGYLDGRGYRANPLEVMAYQLQDRFDQQAPPFDMEAEVRCRLDTVVPALLDRAFKGEL